MASRGRWWWSKDKKGWLLPRNPSHLPYSKLEFYRVFFSRLDVLFVLETTDGWWEPIAIPSFYLLISRVTAYVKDHYLSRESSSTYQLALMIRPCISSFLKIICDRASGNGERISESRWLQSLPGFQCSWIASTSSSRREGGITALKRYKISSSRSNRGQIITSGSFSASFPCHSFAILVGHIWSLALIGLSICCLGSSSWGLKSSLRCLALPRGSPFIICRVKILFKQLPPLPPITQVLLPITQPSSHLLLYLVPDPTYKWRYAGRFNPTDGTVLWFLHRNVRHQSSSWVKFCLVVFLYWWDFASW